MRNIQLCLLYLSLYTLGLFILPSQKAYSQNNTIAVLQDTFNFERLAVVNMDKVLRDAKATERVRELLDNKREEFQNDFAMREASLLQIEKDLQMKIFSGIKLFSFEICKRISISPPGSTMAHFIVSSQ